MQIILRKYHGLGNDYLVYNTELNKLKLTSNRIKMLCNRNFGVGSDGILAGPYLENGKIKVKIFNPDGSEAEKSGNGVRIFAKYLKDSGYIKTNQFILNTLGGDVAIEYLNDKGTLIKASMGSPNFLSSEIPVKGPIRQIINEKMSFNNEEYLVTCVSIGNPHCVIPMEDVSKELACDLGKYVENSENFPNRINMQLLKVMDHENIRIEIYERGAGYTLASGSSSCAAACVAYQLGLTDNNVRVHMPGGSLIIEISDENIYMTGEVSSVGTVMLSEEFVNEIYNEN